MGRGRAAPGEPESLASAHGCGCPRRAQTEAFHVVLCGAKPLGRNMQTPCWSPRRAACPTGAPAACVPAGRRKCTVPVGAVRLGAAAHSGPRLGADFRRTWIQAFPEAVGAPFLLLLRQGACLLFSPCGRQTQGLPSLPVTSSLSRGAPKTDRSVGRPQESSEGPPSGSVGPGGRERRGHGQRPCWRQPTAPRAQAGAVARRKRALDRERYGCPYLPLG